MRTLLLALLLLASASGWTVEPTKKSAEVYSLQTFFDELDQATIEKPAPEERPNFAHRVLVTRHNVTEAGPAILLYWQLHDYHSLELIWWQQRSRANRLLILILFYGHRENLNDPDFPAFLDSAQRFEPREEGERVEEVELVAKNRVLLSKTLREFLLKKSGSDFGITRLPEDRALHVAEFEEAYPYKEVPLSELQLTTKQAL